MPAPSVQSTIGPCGSGLPAPLHALSCSSSSIDLTSPSAVKCQVSVENSFSTSVPPAGASGTLTISTTRDCTWSASSNAAWAQLTGDTSGQGPASLAYRVLANPDAIVRKAVLEVNNTQVSVTQDAAPCRYGVTPANAAVPAAGGSVTVRAGRTCSTLQKDLP